MDQLAIDKLNSKKENMITSMQEMIEEQKSRIEIYQTMIQRKNKEYEKNIRDIMANTNLHNQERQLECQIVETKAFIEMHKLNAKVYVARKNITYIQTKIASF